MDNLVRGLLDEMRTNTFDEGYKAWVDVVHVNNPDSFYVRPRTYIKYLPLLQSRGSHIDATEVKLGNIYVFSCKTTKSIIRGQVVHCERRSGDPTYKMFAVDIGFEEEGVPLNRIWTTLYRLPVPPLTTHCKLADCAPRGKVWDYKAIEAMKSFVEGEKAKIIVRSKNNDKCVVDLYNSRPDDIATLLALTHYTSLGYNSSTSPGDSPVPDAPCYSVRELQVGDSMNVRMQSGSLFNEFFVMPTEEYELFLTDRDNYTSYARSQNEVFIEELKVNMPIGVMYTKNNKFERGLIKELMPKYNTARVYLVDWGFTVEESIMKMKVIPEWYMCVPMRALFCTLYCSESLSSTLATLSYPGIEFQITIKVIGDTDLMIPNVVKIAPSKP